MIQDKSNIMVIDDSESKRTIIQLILMTSGYNIKVHEASNGEDGLAKVLKIKPVQPILKILHLAKTS